MEWNCLLLSVTGLLCVIRCRTLSSLCSRLPGEFLSFPPPIKSEHPICAFNISECPIRLTDLRLIVLFSVPSFSAHHLLSYACLLINVQHFAVSFSTFFLSSFILSSLASFLSSMIPVCLVCSVWMYLLLSLSLRNGFFSVGRASVTPEETAEDMLCGNDWKLIFSAGLSTASY